MHSSAITQLDINVFDSDGVPEIPATGFLSEISSNGGTVVPIIVAIIVPVVIISVIIILRHRKNHMRKFQSPLKKKLILGAKISAIALVVAIVGMVSLRPSATKAADSLIRVTIANPPDSIDIKRDQGAQEVVNIEVTIDTASVNDLELRVSFEDKNNGINLSTTNDILTLPAGTTSATIPVNVMVADNIKIGNYKEPVKIGVAIKESFWRTSGRNIVNRNGEIVALKGFNLSSSVVAWMDNDMPNLDLIPAQHNDFTYGELASLGVNVIRYDFQARMLADSCTVSSCFTYDYKDEVFAMFDDILETADRHGVGVIFNIHNSYGTSNTNETGMSKWDTFLPENIEKTTQLWVDIAKRFKDDKRVLGYDLMNEPSVRLADTETIYDALSKWDTVAQDMIDAIRAVDENHMIVVERLNRGRKHDGATEVGLNIYTASQIFPNVTDPRNNIMFEFHDYGNWNYVTQSDARIANDPWVWPNLDYLGGIRGGIELDYKSEVWPPASMAGTDPQNTWTTVSSGNNSPRPVTAADPAYNMGSVLISTFGASGTPGTLNSDTVIYVDNITVDEYDADNTFIRTVNKQDFRIAEAVDTTNPYGASVVFDQSVCYDTEGGCLKIVGPTTGGINLFTHRTDLKLFRIDSTKKYKITAHIYSENMPQNTSIHIVLAYAYGSDSQVRPYDESYLNEAIQPYVQFSIDNNVPIFNGEFGVLKNGEVWDQIGAAQFVSDSLQVYEDNNINSTYYLYFDWNTNPTQRRSGLRIREYGSVPARQPVDASNTVLNTELYDTYLEHAK